MLAEGIPSANKEFLVSTTTRRVDIATTSYAGAVPAVGLHISSNVVVDSASKLDALVLYSVGGLGNTQATVAQLLSTATARTGTSFYCSNCTPPKIVVSTGTGLGNFADAVGGAFK